jgi:hypothetical protein
MGPHGVTADGDITRIYLDNHNLKGTIPSSLASMTKLNTIRLWGNALTGLVPPCRSNSTAFAT